MPYFIANRLKNHTLCACAFLNSLCKKVPPPATTTTTREQLSVILQSPARIVQMPLLVCSSPLMSDFDVFIEPLTSVDLQQHTQTHAQ